MGGWGEVWGGHYTYMLAYHPCEIKGYSILTVINTTDHKHNNNSNIIVAWCCKLRSLARHIAQSRRGPRLAHGEGVAALEACSSRISGMGIRHKRLLWSYYGGRTCAKYEIKRSSSE